MLPAFMTPGAHNAGRIVATYVTIVKEKTKNVVFILGSPSFILVDIIYIMENIYYYNERKRLREVFSDVPYIIHSTHNIESIIIHKLI